LKIESIVTAKDVSRTFFLGGQPVKAIDTISLEVGAGEFLVLKGKSGSGKSTLLSLIAGLDRPTSGMLEVSGINLTQLNPAQLAQFRQKQIGMIFQSFNLLPRVSAAANVELPLVYSDVSNKRERALAALEAVGLADRATHKPTELSGGEQQRVAIARALVNNPAIILADEPTGNLDTQTSKDIMVLLQRLNKEQGITIVLVTHEPDIAAYTQRSIYLRDGQIVGEEKR